MAIKPLKPIKNTKIEVATIPKYIENFWHFSYLLRMQSVIAKSKESPITVKEYEFGTRHKPANVRI